MCRCVKMTLNFNRRKKLNRNWTFPPCRCSPSARLKRKWWWMWAGSPVADRQHVTAAGGHSSASRLCGWRHRAVNILQHFLPTLPGEQQSQNQLSRSVRSTKPEPCQLYLTCCFTEIKDVFVRITRVEKDANKLHPTMTINNQVTITLRAPSSETQQILPKMWMFNLW